MPELTGIIAVAPIDEVDRRFLSHLLPRIERVIEREVVAAPGSPLPPQAFDPRRRQWSAQHLLSLVASQRQPGWERILGVTNVDLCVPELTFVFGLGDAHEAAAVMSLARFAELPELLQLAATEAIHELGHTYGLRHCNNPSCVMWFSRTLAESQRKGERFCRYHAAQLRRAFGSTGDLSTWLS